MKILCLAAILVAAFLAYAFRWMRCDWRPCRHRNQGDLIMTASNPITKPNYRS